MDEFFGYLQRAYGASYVAAAQGGNPTSPSKMVAIGTSQFYLFYSADERSLLLSAAGPANADLSVNYRLIEEIGQRFNAELAEGKYQNLFTAYPGTR